MPVVFNRWLLAIGALSRHNWLYFLSTPILLIYRALLPSAITEKRQRLEVPVLYYIFIVIGARLWLYVTEGIKTSRGRYPISLPEDQLLEIRNKY